MKFWKVLRRWLGLSGRYTCIEMSNFSKPKLILKHFSGGFPDVDPFFTFVANEKV